MAKARGFRCAAALLVCSVGALVIGGAGSALRTRHVAADPGADGASGADQVGKKQIPVVLTPVREMTFETRIQVSGSVHAKRYAMVSARIPAG